VKLNRRLGISDEVIELIQSITEKKKMDPVDQKAVKKDFDDREDKDIDNDGDVDKSDKYLHNRRKAVSKAMSKGKGPKDQVDTTPALDDTTSVNEEDELNELDYNTLHSYAKKNTQSALKGTMPSNRSAQRTTGLNRALDKMKKQDKKYEEKAELGEMFASTVDAHKDGYRPKVVKDGNKLSYLGQHVYKSKEHARNAADHIANGMRKGRASDSYIQDFARRHHKEHGMKEEVEIEEQTHMVTIAKGTYGGVKHDGKPIIVKAKSTRHATTMAAKKVGIDARLVPAGGFNVQSNKKEEVGLGEVKIPASYAQQMAAKKKRDAKIAKQDKFGKADAEYYKKHLQNESLDEAKADRLQMIRKAAEKIKARNKAAEKDAKSAMRSPGAQRGMAPVKLEAVGVAPDAVDKHNCATHVYHEQWGEGQTIYSMHADPDEYGLIEWYDVVFDHGVEKAVPTNEMKVTREMSHGNHKKKK
jgi:hypothetical protein